jgi:Concanavalin A-like lectin/glucanases superfamily
VTSPLPVLPQLIVEAGLLPDAPVQGGTTLFLNTGPGLDTGTLGTGIGWTDLSARVLGFTITRPSTRLQGPLWNYQPGTCSVLFDNSDGALDPDNLTGPYTSGGATLLTPMVPFRVRAVFATLAYPLFSGFADGWLPAQVTYSGGYAELTVGATDAFKVLGGITLPVAGIEGTGADTGARIKDILSRTGWYVSGDRTIADVGNSTLQGTTLGDTALNLMQIATDSEIGQLYVNGAGAVVFRRRLALQSDTRSNTVQAVFGDLPAAVIQPYDTVIAADAPAAWWKLADAPGSGTAADSSGGGHAGTPASVTFGASGPLPMAPAETAASFDGAASKIDTTYNPSGGSALSVEAWVNLAGRTQPANGRILANSHTDADVKGFQLMLSAGTTPQAWFGNGTTAANVIAAAALPAAGWTHLAATWDGATVRLYVNGAPVAATAALSGTLAAGTATGTGIGYNPAYSGDFTAGLIGQAAVYTAALTPTQVLAHYQAGHNELPYAAVARASDDTTIANDIQATRLGGSLQEAKDTASITKYLFPRTYSRADLILQGDPDALSWAQWVLYVSKGGEDRFESLAVDPAADPYNLWPQVLGREIGDRIQVWHRPAGLASPISKDCFIAGITHTWNSVTSEWLTTWTLMDASKYGSFFTLDNPTLGKLDSNALTF